MPRTIESMINSHSAAAARRDAGRPIWDYRIQIKQLLGDDDSDETARKTGAQVAAILRRSAWFRDDAQRAEERGGESEVALCAEEFDDIDDADHFNGVLDRLYDLADADRAWIG